MKKLIVILTFSFLWAPSFSQTLQNTEWYFMRSSDTIKNVFDTDTMKNYNLSIVNPSPDLFWYKEVSDTFYIVRLPSPNSVCLPTDTGIYLFRITTDTANNLDSLVFYKAISDPCTARATGLPDSRRWRDANLTTGFENQTKDLKLAIFPNPSHGSFNIDVVEPGIIEITDVDGKVTRSYYLTKGRNSIETNLSSGMYFIRLIYLDEIVTSKIIIH